MSDNPDSVIQPEDPQPAAGSENEGEYVDPTREVFDREQAEADKADDEADDE